MHLPRVSAAAALLAAFAVWMISAQEPAPAVPAIEIRMTAKKYEFSPSTIRVKAGQRVKLVITAVDHVHGFKVEALHIDETLEKGEATTVEFTAGQPGTFPFECSHFCGLGHKKMKGELIVE